MKITGLRFIERKEQVGYSFGSPTYGMKKILQHEITYDDGMGNGSSYWLDVPLVTEPTDEVTK